VKLTVISSGIEAVALAQGWYVEPDTSGSPEDRAEVDRIENSASVAAKAVPLNANNRNTTRTIQIRRFFIFTCLLNIVFIIKTRRFEKI
jgi:hypothetical protein